MRDKRQGFIAASHYPRLEGEEVFVIGLLDEVITGDKKDTVARLRKNLHHHTNHPLFPLLKKELLDISIVVYCQKRSFLNQDVDNVAKTVIDALKKPDDPADTQPYFFENDCQVVRLLSYKKQRIENTGHNTCQLAISLRKHDPSKEMILICGSYNAELKTFEIIPFSQLKEGSELVF